MSFSDVFFRMVLVAQLARASGCGPEGRRFEPDRAHPPFFPCFFKNHGIFFAFRKLREVPSEQHGWRLALGSQRKNIGMTDII